MKLIFQLFIVSIFILAGCSAPAPVATSTPAPAQPLPTPTSISKPVFDGQIVYSNENDIFVLNLADSQVTRLTDDPEWDFDAAWSPDGSQIVFRSHRDGDEEIYVMDVDGSNQTNLSKNPGGGDWSPVWSPDGTRIAFFSEREGKSGIWAMDTDGVMPSPWARHQASTITPHGRRTARVSLGIAPWDVGFPQGKEISRSVWQTAMATD